MFKSKGELMVFQGGIFGVKAAVGRVNAIFFDFFASKSVYYRLFV